MWTRASDGSSAIPQPGAAPGAVPLLQSSCHFRTATSLPRPKLAVLRHAGPTTIAHVWTSALHPECYHEAHEALAHSSS